MLKCEEKAGDSFFLTLTTKWQFFLTLTAKWAGNSSAGLHAASLFEEFDAAPFKRNPICCWN